MPSKGILMEKKISKLVVSNQYVPHVSIILWWLVALLPHPDILTCLYSHWESSPKRRKKKLSACVEPWWLFHLLFLNSTFLSSHHPKLSPASIYCKPINYQRRPTSYSSIKAINLDQNTLVAISVGVVSIAVGIGIPVFYETQIENAAKRENTQPCFPCNGSGAQQCRFCTGTGSVTIDLGDGAKEVSRCLNSDGAGNLTCTTCQGTGIQPRYLDRREFKDDD